MQSALRPPVPSRSLLRFLRSQTEVAFFNPSHACDSASALRLGRQASATTSSAAARGKARAISTTCQRRAAVTLEASFFDLRPFLKRSSTIKKKACDAELLPRLYGTRSDVPAKDDVLGDAQNISWQERLWGSSAKKGSTPLKPDDLPSHGDGSSMFNNRRQPSAKAALEPRLRCTEVDENGEVILVDGEFKKTELIAKV
jgi:magnesium transporter